MGPARGHAVVLTLHITVKRAYKEADIVEWAEKRAAQPDVADAAPDQARQILEGHLLGSFNVTSSTQILFVTTTVQQIVTRRLRTSTGTILEQMAVSTVTQQGEGVVGITAQRLTLQQEWTSALSNEKEVLEALLVGRGKAWEQKKREYREHREYREEALDLAQREYEQREKDVGLRERELLLERNEQHSKRQKVTERFPAADLLLKRLRDKQIHNSEALRIVIATFPQLTGNGKSLRCLDEPKWLVTRMLQEDLLTEPRFVKLTVAPKGTWRQVLLDLAGGLPEPPSHTVAAPDTVAMEFQKIMLTTGDMFLGFYSVLMKQPADSMVPVFWRMARLPDCPKRNPRHRPEVANCKRVVHRLVDAAQKGEDAQKIASLVANSGRGLLETLTSCVLWDNTVVERKGENLFLNFSSNPIVVSWGAERRAELYLYVLQHLVVCAGQHANYLTPLYPLSNLPGVLQDETLRLYLDDVHQKLKPDRGMGCFIQGIFEAPRVVRLFSPTALVAKVNFEQWQVGIATQEGDHHLPWAIGYSGKLGAIAALSLHTLEFTSAPGRDAYGEQTANGWYLSHEQTPEGYGIISADPGGGPCAAFVHWRGNGTLGGSGPFEPLMLPHGKCNIPMNDGCLFGYRGNVSLMEASRANFAALLCLEAFDVRPGAWRLQPEHPIMGQMLQALKGFAQLSQGPP